MSDLFILAADGRTPVLAEDIGIWARWHRENPDAGMVNTDLVNHPEGSITVETKFWGSELNNGRTLNPRAPSYLFQTSAFCRGRVTSQRRCGTWEEAEKQHESVVAMLRAEAAGAAATSSRAEEHAAMPEEICTLQT